MTDHDPSFAELTERAHQLGNEAEHLYSVIKRRKEALHAANAQALQATGKAASRDGSVQVTVDGGGMVTDLVLNDRALRTGPSDLAGLITTVAQQAAAQARAAVRAAYEPLRGKGAVPILLPEPAQPAEPHKPPRAKEFEEEASYEERTITRRTGRR
jgi:hypothetical protein